YSLDETMTQYGLLADDMQLAEDYSSIVFHINPRARFSNGDPVLASDVVYSFETLIGDKASPRFRSFFAKIAKASIVDNRTVRFDFKEVNRELAFVVGALPVFSRKWGLNDKGAPLAFDQIVHQP